MYACGPIVIPMLKRTVPRKRNALVQLRSFAASTTVGLSVKIEVRKPAEEEARSGVKTGMYLKADPYEPQKPTRMNLKADPRS